MTTKPTTEQIRTRIDTFLRDISALVNQQALIAVQDALSGAPTTKRRRTASRATHRGPGRPKAAPTATRAPRAGKRIRRSTEAVEKMAERIHTYVKAHPGQGVEQISAGLRIPSKELKLPVIKLLAEKKVRTEGQKRGTKYFVGGKKTGRKAARRAARKAKRTTRRTRKAARKSAPKAKRAVKRSVKPMRREMAKRASAPKARPVARKIVAATETPSIASAMAERIAVAG